MDFLFEVLLGQREEKSPSFFILYHWYKKVKTFFKTVKMCAVVAYDMTFEDYFVRKWCQNSYPEKLAIAFKADSASERELRKLSELTIAKVMFMLLFFV